MSQALREAVLLRDRECIAAVLDKSHRCRDRHGYEHEPDDIARLTVEHVRELAGGERRDTYGWLLALCHDANAVSHWGSANRDICRAYLEGVRRATGSIPPGALARMQLEEAFR